MSASRHRSPRLGALVAAATTLVLTLSACAGGAASSRAVPVAPQSAGGSGGSTLTLGLTYIPNVQFAPVYVAEDDGLYTDAGLDVTIRHHGSDEGLFTALTSGEEDVVLASGDEVLQARDQGLDVVSIGSYYRMSPAAVLIPADSPLHTVADLKGHSVGLPGEYGASWFALLAFLDRAGLTRDDMEVESIGYTQMAALTSGQVDAVVGFTNNDLVQLEAAGTHVRVLDGGSDAPLVAASLVTTQQWLDAHPEQARALVRATAEGINRAAADPDHAVEVTRTRDTSLGDDTTVSTARAVLAATLDLMRPGGEDATGSQDRTRWEEMASFLRRLPEVLTRDADIDAAMRDLTGSEQR